MNGETMKTLNLMTATLAIILLTACSSPKEANKDNFKTALDAYYGNNCILVGPRQTDFPVTVQLLAIDNKNAKRENSDRTDEYEVFKSLGLLEVEDGTVVVNKNRFSNKKITVPTKVYSLTALGKKSYRSIQTKSFFRDTETGFCAAKYKVNEIINFSEPTPSRGYTISNVSFSIMPKKVRKWASDDSLLKQFPKLAEKLQDEQEETVVMVLMNDGWIHEKELKK